MQGTVTLRLIVGADGRPREVQVQKGLGMGLDEKAMAAVQMWRFEPSTRWKSIFGCIENFVRTLVRVSDRGLPTVLL
jgi:hypothetical protein